jgi:hypothetical protein
MASIAPYDYELDPRNQTLSLDERNEVEDLLDRTAATIAAAFFLGASVLLFVLVVYRTFA